MRSLYFLLQLALLVFLAKVTSANHLLGGEINYKFISASGNTQVYRVTLSFFADCSSNIPQGAFSRLVNADPEVRLYRNNTFITSSRLNYDPAQSDIEITPVCPDEANNTACIDINNPIPGIKKFVYNGTFTLTGMDDNWRFAFLGSITNSSGSATSAGRSFIIENAEVTDPTAGTATIMYLEATLNNTLGPNSSTTFTSLPTPFFCLNKASTYSLGASDFENDQLTFSLIPGKSVSNNPPPEVIDVTYLPPFSSLFPLPTAPGNFNFNSTNGQMNFTPNEVKNCLVTNLVEEFRSGVKVGSSMREMTFIILDNCNNDAPIGPVSAIQNANIVVDSPDNLRLSVCEGQTSNISFDISSVDPNGDNISVTYSNLQSGATVIVDNNGTDSPVVHFTWNVNEAAPGNYLFYITYTDDGCPLVSTKTVAYTITVIPHPITFNNGSTGTCIGRQTGKAWAVPEPGITDNYHYRWVNTAGDTLKETDSNIGDTLTNIPAGTYKVYVRNEEGCGKNIVIIVKEIPLPEISLPADTVVCAGLPIDITTIPQNDVSYLWNTGDTTCCITATNPGIYTLKVTNLCGDVEDAMALEYVKCNYCLFVPNAFSPNGDGKNDKFNVLETCLIEKYQLQIFNRWGELVFTTLSTEKSWDGTYNGKEAESGVYYYMIDAIPIDRSKGTVQLKGDITLIR
ncbi:MAG: gliding motility-associated C-terminal domain-containing protein [Taibaiella sp.]|jgi:gliding motility-associated-like protein